MEKKIPDYISPEAVAFMAKLSPEKRQEIKDWLNEDSPDTIKFEMSKEFRDTFSLVKRTKPVI